MEESSTPTIVFIRYLDFKMYSISILFLRFLVVVPPFIPNFNTQTQDHLGHSEQDLTSNDYHLAIS